MIFLLQWVRTHPQVQSWSIISRTIVVHTNLLIKFLGVEEVRRVLRIVAFFKEYFAKWNVFDMLRYFAIKVGDVTATAQVVRMIVELHLFVVVLVMEIIIYSSTCNGIHSPCLYRFGRTIVTTELSCQREECELARKFPSAADNVLWTNPDRLRSRHCPDRCMGCQRYDNLP